MTGAAMSEREEKFERMLAFVRASYEPAVGQMQQLKAEGKTKPATYRQLMGNKLNDQTLLSLYERYGLL